MNVRELSPEQIQVLKLIQSEGISAKLDAAQRDISDQLQALGLVEGLGDEYDFDVYLSAKARLLLDQTDPAWWVLERQRREKDIEQIKKRIENEPIYHDNDIRRLTEEWEKATKTENERSARYLANLKTQLTDLEFEFQAWIDENKDDLS